MEEPEQEREDGIESPKGCGARGAAPRRLACGPPSPRGTRRRRRGRFAGGLRGLPLLPARPRPPPPATAAAAATAAPYPAPPRPPARPGSPSVPPATNCRCVLACPQPITSGAATPHTPLSWKQPRHPRPAALAPPPAPARATPPPPLGRRSRRGWWTRSWRVREAAATPTFIPAQSLARVREIRA